VNDCSLRPHFITAISRIEQVTFDEMMIPTLD